MAFEEDLLPENMVLLEREASLDPLVVAALFAAGTGRMWWKDSR